MTNAERAAQIWSVLVLAAHNRQVLTYGMVGRLIGVPQHALAGKLAPIQAYCLQHDLPPLTALVVNGETGLPGHGLIAAGNVPEAQAKVFAYGWLKSRPPKPAELAAAAGAASSAQQSGPATSIVGSMAEHADELDAAVEDAMRSRGYPSPRAADAG